MNTLTTTISLRHQTEDDLFYGADAQDLATTDIAASVASFEAEWERRVQEAYPAATIAWARTQREAVSVDALYDENTFAAYSAIEAHCQQLAEELYQDGSAWVVEAPTGKLYRYEDAEYLRVATPQEVAASANQALHDGGAGAIEVDGVVCYAN